jgi:hypothetical protein
MNGYLPNTAHGFARSAAESACPALWRGYLGGIAPWTIGRNCANPGPSRYGAATQGTAWNVVGSPLGRAMQFAGNASVQWDGHATLGNPFKVANGGGPVTIQANFRYTHKASANRMYLFRSDNQTVGQPAYGYGLYVDANQDRLVFTTDRGNGGDPLPAAEWKSASSSLSGGKWHHVVASFYEWDVGDVEIQEYVVMWIDGALLFPSVPAIERAFVHRNADHSRCGATNGNTQPDFEIDLLSVWNARMAWREIDILNADPLAMFRPCRVAGLTKAPRRVTLGGATLRRMNAVLTG